jgi:hypothetical protein
MVRDVPNELEEGLRVNWRRLVCHLPGPFLRQLPSTTDVHKRVVRYLAMFARRNSGHWILAVDDTEQVFTSSRSSKVIDFLEEWRHADTRGGETVHVAKAILGECRFCLAT